MGGSVCRVSRGKFNTFIKNKNNAAISTQVGDFKKRTIVSLTEWAKIGRRKP
jgi:hypothetical protein